MTARAFADALLARYACRAVSPVPLGVVFRRPPRPGSATRVVERLVRQDVRVELRPRIELTLVREAGVPPAGVDTVRSTTFARHETLVLRTRAVERVERVLERIVARGVRVEAPRPGASPAVGHVAAAAAASRAPVSPVPAARFPALVVERHPTPDAAPPRPSVDRAAATAAIPAGGGGVAVQPVELERMTDHVLAALDRRLVAQRERLGRP